MQLRVVTYVSRALINGDAALRRDLLEYLAPEGRQDRLPHFVSFFRLCLSANREGAMPEDVVVEPPRFQGTG